MEPKGSRSKRRGSHAVLDVIVSPRERRIQPREHWRSRHEDEDLVHGRQVFEDEWDAKSGSTRNSQSQEKSICWAASCAKHRARCPSYGCLLFQR